ncbi:hypothetical protein [Labilibaculum antarcticum]|uniref:DUF4412 domain-containing protein n=1 Tax=Labilibaculum antarcticum TaxID=1717717 RepID=A0A1Y1CHY7_9BACT|nr:hypothetical protein [Labilibaculum antarcticum]BAX79935.1 hypothetical protein ALGA_1559 [Labilibaculum antarcticum]
MRKIIVICFFAFGFCLFGNAQETALTSKGKVVILYENGTWKYADVSVSGETQAQQTENTVLTAIQETAISNEPLVLKDAEVEKITFIEGASEKLQKYFKDKNIVRCDFTLSSKEGKATITTEWKIMNGEAYSYFGYIKKEAKLSLELLGGETVDLAYNNEFEPKEFKKYGFSTYSAELELTEDQLELLQNKIVLKATMNWSRRAEEYQVVDPSYFIKTIPQITE